MQVSSTPNGVVMIGRVGYCPPNFSPFRCDRNTGSPLRNPFKENDREVACNKFGRYFKEEMGNPRSKVRITTRRLLRRLKKGENICLQCHCVPLRCHTEFIKHELEEGLK